MQKTQQFNRITRDYSIDEFLALLAGKPVEKTSLLRLACERVWSLPCNGSLPSSLDVALLLSELGVDETTLVVALLSSSYLLERVTLASLEPQFGANVIHLVESVQQLHAFHREEENSTPEQVERLRRMLLSMVDDVRVVLIKLAYRVQRLRQLKLAPRDEQLDIARESLEIFAPIANRLGIGQLKWELEDLAFRYLEPEAYRSIAAQLDDKREGREKFIAEVVETLKKITAEHGLQTQVYGRPKHIYSIWKKMTAKQRSFDELFDVRAVRVVTETVAECYMVLGIVHAQWHHISKEFDDYIANPKENGYQSLHTAVYGPLGKPLEIQIRTEKMHEFAEHGVAAHWRYKEDNQLGSNIQASIDSLRKLLDNAETGDDELLERFRSEMFHDRVFTLTPEGRVIDLPEGATPIDFAYAVHTEIGHRCRGAKVNGQIVQLTYPLKNGERVEILTAREASPRRDWMIAHLGFIKTSRARNRIRSWFRKQDHDKNCQDGKAIYERELKRHGVRPDIDVLVRHFKLQSADELFVNLGRGDISVAQLSSILHEHLVEDKAPAFPVFAEKKTHTRSSSSGINVLGVGNLLTSIANCCTPVPHDDIIGYITRDKGVSVHRKDCKNILHLREKDQLRLIEVEWGETEVQSYPVTINIQAIDRHGLLSDIMSTLSIEKINVIAVNTLSNKSRQTAKMSVTVEIRDLQQLNRIMDKLGLLRNVLDVSRSTNSSPAA